jgi:GntR family transcriptional regulator
VEQRRGSNVEKSKPAGQKALRIAQDLEAGIAEGIYPPGGKLPGESALAKQYSVAAVTARQALLRLRSLGVAESRHGTGFFVNVFQRIHRHGVSRLNREKWGAGTAIWDADDDRIWNVDQVEVRLAVEPPQHIAELLGARSALTRSRRYTVEGRPVMVAISWLDQDLVGDSPIARKNPGAGGVYARLAELGREPTRFSEAIRITLPAPETMEQLGVPAERPLYHIVRTAYDAEARVVEVNDMFLDSAAYILEYGFDA